MHYVYILKSLKIGKHYIGETGNLCDRIKRHNENRSKATKGKGPWKLVIACEVRNKSEAMRLEKKLKSFKSPEKAISYIRKHYSAVEHPDC